MKAGREMTGAGWRNARLKMAMLKPQKSYFEFDIMVSELV